MRSGPVANALLGKRDLYINDRRYSRSLFGRIINTASFGILPICVDGVVLGCLYFDRGNEPEPVSEEMRHLIAKLRDLAGEAIRMLRDAAAIAS